MTRAITDEDLRRWVTEVRERSIELVTDLSEEQLRVPYLPTVNPIVWEFCHAAYFFEYWVLRQGAGQPPVRRGSEELFDSMTVGHETRWRLPVPNRAEALDYVADVQERVLALIDAGLPNERLRYLIAYSVFHEDMHTEALTYTRQTLGYAAPTFDLPRATSVPISRDTNRGTRASAGEPLGDATVSGGRLELGAARDVPFCFDNEKWAHPVEVEPFAIARTAVTEGELAAFVREGGYERRELWTTESWAWRQAVQADLPVYWRRTAEGDLERRHFDRWTPLDDRRAMIHVSWYEAEAWCRWAGRRLPTEIEWEAAAALDRAGAPQRTQPWGEEPPGPERCNLDWYHMGPVDVAAYPEGESAAGCRQLIGNVWEWTATTFRPYPAFESDMYVDYSQTSFHTRKVLRGGCWATRSRTIRSTWRNYFQPGRRDVLAGFRTCAL